MQYTLRNVPPHLDRALRHRVQEEKKSLNEVVLEALLQAFALRGEGLKRRDLSDVAGTWIEDPEVDRALEEQRKIEPEWSGEVPPEIAEERAVSVDVTIRREERSGVSPAAHAGERMAAALEQLAASNATASIEDPVAWQRRVRRDRPLPGRDSEPENAPR